MEGHWADAYYGDLYYESVADLLTARLSTFEAGLIRRMLEVGPGDRVLDLACGHGRHARALSPEVGFLAGLDRNPAYLERARHSGAALVRGDLRALPFRPASFDALYSWYSSLFMYDDEENARCLAAAVALLKPGGRIVVHHDNPGRLRRETEATAAWDLPGGGRVEEESRYDPATGRDSCTRRVIRADGSVLAGTAHLRYYNEAEWLGLAARCGLELLRITSTWQADRPSERLDDDAPDLIAIGRRSA
ncbi:MAG TPA: class I SAM-dependent methyltransferase [Anaeromyxobacteraceae bacterium]|nr:class I SAM-dependent methyltransferase [Anaeromyxobacteraceae bacterium]